MKNKSLIILCYIVLSLSNAEAWQRNSAYERLKKDPANSADVVVVGKLFEDGNGEQFLIPERRWTQSPNEIYIPETGDIYNLRDGLKKRGITGEKYLLYMGIFSNYKVIELLKNSRKTIDKFAAKKYYWGGINPSWQFCESDSECIQSKNLCGNPIGVNKKYEKDYLRFLKSKKLKADCSKTEKSRSSVSKCVDNFCS